MPSYAEIKMQIAQLERQAAEQRKSEVASVITDIRSKMAQYGLTIQDIGPVKGKRGSANSTKAIKVSSPAKYKDPATGKTWTGHGKQPAWIVEATKKGKRDDYLIGSVKASIPVKAVGKVAKPVKESKATKAAQKASLRKPVSAKPSVRKQVVVASKAKKTTTKKTTPQKVTTKAVAVKKTVPPLKTGQSTTR